MSWLSLNIARYRAVIKNLEWTWYSKYPITKEEYWLLKAWRDMKVPFIWIHDIEWNRVREINPRDIKEFEPITKVQSWYWYNAVCSFWWRHPIHNWSFDCDCAKKFWCSWLVFKDKLKEALGVDIFYDSDITEDMRNKYLTIKNNNTSYTQ